MPHMSEPPPDALAGFQIDPDEGLALVRMKGTLSGEDMLEISRTVHAHPDWQDGFDAIWDCSRVRAHVVAPEDVPPIIEEEASTGAGRDLLIESRAVGESQISRLLAAWCRREGKPARVYPSLEAALDSLGRTELPASLQTEA